MLKEEYSPSQVGANDTKRHLEALFGDAIDSGLHFGICASPDYGGRWFTSIDAALKFVASKRPKANLYVACGMRREPPPKGKRGDAAEVAGVAGAWADIDFAGPAHAKPNLPPDEDAARQFIRDFTPMHPPSLIVHSGHGLQAWWLFDEPWIFDGPAERERAQLFARRWGATIAAVAKAKGYAVDSVHDLARLMRLAGTVNRKSEPVPTSIEHPAANDPIARYCREDLESLLVDEEQAPDERGNVVARVSVGRLTLNPAAKPDPEKFSALIENADLAKTTWEHNRPELADQSASGYDMALAMIAARNGFTDQEIADLLIAHRRKHGANLKTSPDGTLRQDYYQRTISKARVPVNRERAVAELSTISQDSPTAGRITDDQRAGILRRAFDVLGVPIKRFVQYGEEGATYILELSDGRSITLGGAEALENQRRIRAKIFEIVQTMFEPIKLAAWTRLMTELGIACEFEDDPDAGDDAQMAGLMADYLADHDYALAPNDRRASSAGRGAPFSEQAAVYVNWNHFERWSARLSASSRPTRRQFSVFVRSLKATHHKKVDNRQRGRPSARYWAIEIERLEGRCGSLPFVRAGGGTEGAASARAAQERFRAAQRDDESDVEEAAGLPT